VEQINFKDFKMAKKEKNISMAPSDFFEKEDLSEDKLSRLNELCKRQIQLENGTVDESLLSEILTALEKFDKIMSVLIAEGILKHYYEKLRKISQEYIPAIMNETGMKELTLKSGYKVIVENKLKASIADKNYKKAFEEMVKEKVKEGFKKKEAETLIRDLFKEQLIISNESITPEVKTTLFKNGIDFDEKMDIHYQTLTKYCREQLANGRTIPEGISHFEYQETKIKK
jgi:hypothetical protein